MTSGDGRSVTIMRLHAAAPPGGAVAARLRAERLLGAAALHPTDLPPGAVLVVRAVRVRASLAAAAPRRRDTDAARAEAAQCLRGAARPAHGPVPGSAASVLFIDAAEMLACLTRDVLAGRAHTQWYWRATLSRLPSARGSTLAQIWARDAALLPAAVAQLGAETAAIALRDMHAAEHAAVAAALSEAYGLALDADGPPARATPPTPAPLTLAPWHPWLPPHVADRLPAAAARLLGTALVLWHAPEVARSERFGAQARSWHASRARPPLHDPRPEEDPPEPGAATDGTLDAPIAGAPPRPASLEPRPRIGFDPRRQAGARRSARQPDPVQPVAEQPAATAEAGELPAAGAEAAGARPAAGRLTQAAGALYLINVLAALGWPRFEPDAGEERTIAGWRLLEALARTLLQAPEDDDDPLWTELAVLDRRPAGSVHGLHGQEAREWLDGVVDAVCRLVASRLRRAPSDPWIDLLRVPGRLVAGRTHVDLFMRLDCIDIGIRAGGLDRDPGWVPELGRVVLFHFDS